MIVTILLACRGSKDKNEKLWKHKRNKKLIRFRNGVQTQFIISICWQSVTNHGLYWIEHYNCDLVIWIESIRPSESIRMDFSSTDNKPAPSHVAVLLLMMLCLIGFSCWTTELPSRLILQTSFTSASLDWSSWSMYMALPHHSSLMLWLYSTQSHSMWENVLLTVYMNHVNNTIKNEKTGLVKKNKKFWWLAFQKLTIY